MLLLGAFKDALEFGESQQILRSTGGSFRPYEPRQINSHHRSFERLDADAVLFYIVVGSETHDLSQKIDFADVGLQSESRAVAEGYFIPNEGKVGGKSPWPRVKRSESSGEAFLG